MDRLEAMALLVDTAEAGSFSAAARHRDMPVASLTRKIGQLERQLGAVLLIRSTRRLTLTDAGQRYVLNARRLLAQVGEMERDAAGEFVEPTGRLVVSAPRAFGRLHVLPVVGDFLRQHADISIDLQLMDSIVDLSAGTADLAVRFGSLPDSGLIATALGTMRAVTVASPALIGRHGVPRHPDDLATWPEIVLDIPLPRTVARAQPGRAGQGARRARLTVSGAEAAVDAADSGIGFVHLLHYQAAASLKAGRLRLLLESFEAPPVPVHLLHAPLAQLPLKTRHFFDYARDRLRHALRSITQT